MSRRAALALLAALPAAVAGQGAERRWLLLIHAPDGIERADLRLGTTGGRILFPDHDARFAALADLRIDEGRIVFSVPSLGRTIEGRFQDTLHFQGRMTGAGAEALMVRAERIPAGTDRWPVRPRVTVRALALGASARAVRVTIPTAWHRRLTSPARLAAEARALRAASGFADRDADETTSGVIAVALGLDDDGRRVLEATLTRIAASPAADAEFRRLFVGGDGLVLDLHDQARRTLANWNVAPAWESVARGLTHLGRLGPAERDPARLRDAVWRLWNDRAAGDAVIAARLDTLLRSDSAAGRALGRHLDAYADAAEGWWPAALRWLLRARWLDAPGGPASPAALVAGWWGADALPLPAIVPHAAGGFAASPRLGAGRLTPFVVRAANASATEWLAAGHGTEALAAWRALDWPEPRTLLGDGPEAMPLGTPAGAALGPLASWLGARDEIVIDPAIAPLAAVAVAIHEWHHLLASGARLAPGGGGLDSSGRVLRLHDEDPWLAEGFAEWATEETLRPVRSTVPLLSWLDAAKRAALGASDDPHVMGYRLVRALAEGREAGTLRRLLLRRLHDPAGLARDAGFPVAGPAPLRLTRPATALLVPALTFLWDDGVADDVRRQLVPPPSSPEF